MAKVSAPLFGFDAAGSVGKTVTFSTWRGVKYAKRHTIPANPKTTSQQEVRNIFSMLNSFWKLAPTGFVAPWTAYAKGRSFVDRNAFTGKNVALLNNSTPLTTMATLLASPGAGGAPPPSALVATAGSEQISCALTLPQAPTGWTLASSYCIAFIDQAPSAAFSQEIAYNSEASTPETNVITGLTAGEDYVVCGFLVWTKPDGSTAYSVSLNDTATPTA